MTTFTTGYTYVNIPTGKLFTFVSSEGDKLIWQPQGAKYTATPDAVQFYPQHVIETTMPEWAEIPYKPGDKLTNPGGSVVTILQAMSDGHYRAEFDLPTGRKETRVISLGKLQTFLHDHDTPAAITPLPVDGEGTGVGLLPVDEEVQGVGSPADAAARVAGRDQQIAELQAQLKRLQEQAAATRQAVLNGGVTGNRKQGFVRLGVSEAEYTQLLNAPRTTITTTQFVVHPVTGEAQFCVAGYTNDPPPAARIQASRPVGMTSIGDALSGMLDAATRLGAEIHTGGAS